MLWAQSAVFHFPFSLFTYTQDCFISGSNRSQLEKVISQPSIGLKYPVWRKKMKMIYNMLHASLLHWVNGLKAECKFPTGDLLKSGTLAKLNNYADIYISKVTSRLGETICVLYLLFVQSNPQRTFHFQSHQLNIDLWPLISQASQVSAIKLTVLFGWIPVHFLSNNFDWIIKYFHIAIVSCWFRGVWERWICAQ